MLQSWLQLKLILVLKLSELVQFYSGQESVTTYVGDGQIWPYRNLTKGKGGTNFKNMSSSCS